MKVIFKEEIYLNGKLRDLTILNSYEKIEIRLDNLNVAEIDVSTYNGIEKVFFSLYNINGELVDRMAVQ